MGFPFMTSHVIVTSQVLLFLSKHGVIKEVVEI